MIISIVGTKYNDNNVINLDNLIRAYAGIHSGSNKKLCLYLSMLGDRSTIQIFFNTEEEVNKALDFIVSVGA